MSQHATKRCSKCGQVKPLEAFSVSRKNLGGRQSQCRQCHLETVRQWRAEHPEQAREAGRRSRRPDEDRKRRNAWRAAVRQAVFAHYGTACACCGRTTRLTIDHVNGDGRAHRMELFGDPMRGGSNFYPWLIKNGFPSGFQTLCGPCNASKGAGDRCGIRHRDRLWQHFWTG